MMADDNDHFDGNLPDYWDDLPTPVKKAYIENQTDRSELFEAVGRAAGFKPDSDMARQRRFLKSELAHIFVALTEGQNESGTTVRDKDNNLTE